MLQRQEQQGRRSLPAILVVTLTAALVILFSHQNRYNQTIGISRRRRLSIPQVFLDPRSVEVRTEKALPGGDGTCELPSCSLVLQSRLFSERCGTAPAGWPLLITGTPRSGTSFASEKLKELGMEMQNDWLSANLRDGRVSWIFAFEDSRAYHHSSNSRGLKFENVLRQVKEPLSSITSLCVLPLATGYTQRECDDFRKYVRRHTPARTMRRKSLRFDEYFSARIILDFYLDWHTFLNKLRLPTYQVENVDFRDVIELAGLGQYYHENGKEVSTSHNSREHRESFTWQELYTIDPVVAAEVWELAHAFGYSYPDVNFDELTCMDYMPLCSGERQRRPDRCPPGTHPHPTDMSRVVPRPANANGLAGWVDVGCVERKLDDGSLVGAAALPPKA
ncbi:hypothetical protein ACHAWF_008602 [Thalassiosira exigua]